MGRSPDEIPPLAASLFGLPFRPFAGLFRGVWDLADLPLAMGARTCGLLVCPTFLDSHRAGVQGRGGLAVLPLDDGAGRRHVGLADCHNCRRHCHGHPLWPSQNGHLVPVCRGRRAVGPCVQSLAGSRFLDLNLRHSIFPCSNSQAFCGIHSRDPVRDGFPNAARILSNPNGIRLKRPLKRAGGTNRAERAAITDRAVEL